MGYTLDNRLGEGVSLRATLDMVKIISPRAEKAKQEKPLWKHLHQRYQTVESNGKLYWESDLVFTQSGLIRRAAELLNQAESNISWEHGLFTPYWHELRDQWMKDAGLGK